ncbi:MAG: NAD-dependent epimerase/dehydratase family protein [Chloroflexota bacterium]
MTVVVTGVAGFIGSHLARRLLDQQVQDVVGIDCLTDYYEPSLKRSNLSGLLGDPRFRFEQLDLAQDGADFVADASCVYHLAGQPGVRMSWGDGFASYVRNNIVATHRLLEAMRESTGRLVFASSSSVYGDADRYPTTEDSLPQPSSPYGVTKLCSEQLVMAYARSAGLDARCVRYFTVYGPRQRPDMAFSRFIAAAQRGEPVEIYGDGQQTRDFTYVSDAVDATVRAGSVTDAGKRIFNVGGGSRATVLDVLRILGDILGKPLDVRRLPPQPGDVRDTGADLSRARDTLGWSPRVTLANGLRAQVKASA